MSLDHRPLLAAQSDAALFYALGMFAARPLRAQDAGRIAALCTELRRRNVYDELMTSLSVDQREQLRMLEIADRGQHSKLTGQCRLV